ncbi:MAG: glycerol-3-phosphate acyltransferase [Chloroflexi bacterium]|nr:glycerol-3-phosphate acyltransferase [Chloroflexota bacterium]
MNVNAVIGVVLAYILGSFPSAYVITRWRTGKDIRKLGGGNVGALNTFREVGVVPGLTVLFADIAKGAAATAIVRWLLDSPPLVVMLAGLAVIVGHNWSLFLKFTGGRGMAAALGVLAVTLTSYGYTNLFLILLGIIAIPLVITQNVSLSSAIGVFFLPLVVWLGTQSALATILTVLLGTIMGLKYLPAARQAWSREPNKRNFIFDRLRR